MSIAMLCVAAVQSCGDEPIQIDMIRGKYAVGLGDYSDLAKITVKYLSGNGDVEAVVDTSDKLQVFDDIEMTAKTQPFMPFTIGGYLYIEPRKDAVVDESKTYYFPYYFEIDFHGYFEGVREKGADYNVKEAGILRLEGAEIRQIIDNYVDRGPAGLLIYCIDGNGVMTKAIPDGDDNSSGNFGKIVLGGKKNNGNFGRGTRKINVGTTDTNNFQQ